MKADKLAIILLIIALTMAACSPQAADEGELPTLIVLPTLEPTTEPTTAPPTVAATETQMPTSPPAATAVPPTEGVVLAAANPGDGNMLPGCDTWQDWDATRLELRDTIYAQSPAADVADTALSQVEQLRAEVALLDYDECLSIARSAYLNALDAAVAALSAPDRDTADSFEAGAANSLAEFDNAIRVLENS